MEMQLRAVRTMHRKAAIIIVCVCLWPVILFAQQPSWARLEITTSSLESCVVDQPCSQRLSASGGVAPLAWRIARGSLPPGFQLDPVSGTISGTAFAAGDYEVLIEVSDSSKPPQKASRLFTTRSLPALTLDWKSPPALQQTTISGSVAVSNNGDDVIDLTVIIVAVNEIGKAFALGYQRLNLSPKTTIQQIPFESQMPMGRYTVRADAVGEVPPKNKIYRAARESASIQVTSPQ